jgi:hypothetical protein
MDGTMVRTSDKLIAWLRRLATPLNASGGRLGSSATLNAQFWLGQFPFRPTAGWFVLTAILAVGFPSRPLDLTWAQFVLLLLLVDPLWGAIWRLAAGREELLPIADRIEAHGFWLPYLRPGSPASRLFGREEVETFPLIFRVALPGVLLAFFVATAIGTQAVLLTGFALGLAILGWISVRTLGLAPNLLHSLVTVALPWLMTLGALGITSAHPHWSAFLILLLFWVFHNWGQRRCLRESGDWLGIGLLVLGDLGIAVLLLAVRAPIWLALLVLLWLPTWISIYFRRPLLSARFWWLIAMLVSGLALGQSL